MRTVAPVSPGEMLNEEFLKPLGLTTPTAGYSIDGQGTASRVVSG